VTPELAAAVAQAIRNDDVAGYHISRLSWFCGQPMRHSGWHPELGVAAVPARQGAVVGGHEATTRHHRGDDQADSRLILHYPVATLEDARAKAITIRRSAPRNWLRPAVASRS